MELTERTVQDEHLTIEKSTTSVLMYAVCKTKIQIGRFSVGLGILSVALLALLPPVHGEHMADSRHFGGYRCATDCKEAAEGFRWAREHHVTKSEDCLKDPPSFADGCRVYLRDRLRDPSQDDDGKPIR
jgi:hypothetical protein